MHRYTLILTALASVTPGLALAQASRIDTVLVYPGGAQIERIVSVKAGAQSLELPCLPGGFDANTLSIQGEGVQVGEIKAQRVERAAATECINTALEARIREIEDRRAQFQAESGAQDALLATLKNVGQGVAAGQIASASEAVKAQAQAALLKQAQLQRRIEEQDQLLAPLLAERKRWEEASTSVTRLSARIQASRDVELRLIHRTAAAGWQPVYRARLDTATGQVRLERRAEVGQSSGEDWSGVTLKLSTVQPQQLIEAPQPQPWLLDLRTPAAAMYSSAPAPAFVPPPELRMTESGKDLAARPFDVSVFEGEFAMEFAVPGKAVVATGNERVTFALGQTALDGKLVARVNPAAQATAFLIAETQRPKGAWPAGPAQMYRDNAFVGETSLQMPADGKLDLPFGRDEQIRVVVEPQARNAGERGFIGSRVEERIAHAYRVESTHTKPFTVQLLEASPVSQHEDIKVQARFDPPQPLPWREEQGVKVWEFTLAPGATRRVTADYTLSWPKDMRIGGLR